MVLTRDSKLCEPERCKRICDLNGQNCKISGSMCFCGENSAGWDGCCNAGNGNCPPCEEKDVPALTRDSSTCESNRCERLCDENRQNCKVSDGSMCTCGKPENGIKGCCGMEKGFCPPYKKDSDKKIIII